jgi:hypothetical protein
MKSTTRQKKHAPRLESILINTTCCHMKQLMTLDGAKLHYGFGIVKLEPVSILTVFLPEKRRHFPLFFQAQFKELGFAIDENPFSYRTDRPR